MARKAPAAPAKARKRSGRKRTEQAPAKVAAAVAAVASVPGGARVLSIEEKRCTHVDADGKACRAWRIREAADGPLSPFCFVHHPERREDAQAARILGGKNNTATKHLKPEQIPAQLRTPEQIVQFLEIVIKETAAGNVGNGTASTVGFLAQASLNAMKQGGIGLPDRPRPRGLILRTPIPDSRKRRRELVPPQEPTN